MANIDVLDLGGKKVGSLELAEEIFAPGEVNEALLWEAVKHYRAALRQGTAATKNRKLVSGSGKKLWKQKGTGRARVGSVRSPLWRHGGTVHGPVPRKYGYALPKKMITGALRSALSSKLAQEKLTVVDGWSLDSHKTKLFSESLRKLDKDTRTILLVATGANLNLERASRNLEGVTLVPATSLGPYDLMRHDRLMLSREAAEKLSRALSASSEGAPAAVASSEGEAAEPAKKVAPAKAAVKKEAAPKAAKKPAAAKGAKPKSAKPKAKKD